jgi:hypothetical protein
VTAYEEPLRALGLKDRSDPITQLVAEKINAVAPLGIEDPAEISKAVLKELGTSLPANYETLGLNVTALGSSPAQPPDILNEF